MKNDIYTHLQDLCLSTSKNSEFFLLFLSIHASTSELKLLGAQLVGCVYLLVLKTQSTSLVGQCKCCQQLSEHWAIVKHVALTLWALVLLREPHLSWGDSGLLRKSSLDSSNISATHLHCFSNISSLSEKDILHSPTRFVLEHK